MGKKPTHRSVTKSSSIDSVVDAYIHLSYEIGIANITVQKIADRAGVAFGTVRYYFSSDSGALIHEAAFKRVMGDAYQTIDRIFTELRKKSDFNAVHAYIEAMFEWISVKPEQGSFLIYYYYLSSSKAADQTQIVFVNQSARQRVASLLLEAIGKGVYKPVSDENFCANHIHATVVGHGFIGLAMRSKAAFLQQKKVCLQTVDAFIDSRKLG